MRSWWPVGFVFGRFFDEVFLSRLQSRTLVHLNAVSVLTNPSAFANATRTADPDTFDIHILSADPFTARTKGSGFIGRTAQDKPQYVRNRTLDWLNFPNASGQHKCENKQLTVHRDPSEFVNWAPLKGSICFKYLDNSGYLRVHIQIV